MFFFGVYDNNGNLVWVKNLPCTSYSGGADITSDNSGNILLCGTFNGTLDLDPGAGTNNKTSAGLSDIFISKYNSSGIMLWGHSIGGTDYDEAKAIATDGSGNSFLTGSMKSTVDFDPGPGTSNITSTGSYDAFLASFNNSGTFSWVFNLGGTGVDVSNAIAVQGSMIYIGGSFSNTADFDPGAGISNLISAGNEDIFIAQYTTSGNYNWSRALSGSFYESCRGLNVDLQGNLIATGQFGGTVDFDGGTGTTTLTAPSTSVFTTKYSSTGNFQWVLSIDPTFPNASEGNAVCIDNYGSIYVTGEYTGTADFDPGVDSANYSSNGNRDGFIAKYCVPNIQYFNDSVCNGNVYVFPDGDTSSVSTIHESYIATNYGCDSIITTTLSVISLPTPTILQNWADLSTGTFVSYQWYLNGTPISGATSQTFTMTQNGTYTVEVYNSSGCSGISAPFVMNSIGLEDQQTPPIIVFPNPTHGNMQINNAAGSMGHLMGLDGKVVQTITINSNEQYITLDVASGIYVLVVTNETFTISEKIIVLK